MEIDESNSNNNLHNVLLTKRSQIHNKHRNLHARETSFSFTNPVSFWNYFSLELSYKRAIKTHSKIAHKETNMCGAKRTFSDRKNAKKKIENVAEQISMSNVVDVLKYLKYFSRLLISIFKWCNAELVQIQLKI